MKKQFIGTLFLSLLWISSLIAQDNKQVKVRISTPHGDMVAILYNETPQHRDNFIKLIKEGWYKDSPFHRIIKNFMIQGGQNADGQLDPGYTVPVEIVPGKYHKKGALAAARMPDQVNPTKASSGSQLYIVQGQIFSQDQLASIGARKGSSYTDEQIKTYTTVGGYPPLDGDYTVFGEIIDGFEVIDLIAAVKTGQQDVPVEAISMNITIIE